MTCGVFTFENHPAIRRGQTVDIFWEENCGDEFGYAIYPHGGPSKSEAGQLDAFGKPYFNVPKSYVRTQQQPEAKGE